jgi:hypothetical protein
MERPSIKYEPKQREVTGEIVYLDEKRRRKEEPSLYLELSDMAIQNYEEAAGMMRSRGVRPEIMDDYEKYDHKVSDTVASCSALADVLFSLKEQGNKLTFVDIVVFEDAKTVLDKLSLISAGKVLADNNQQLAFSDDPNYPSLDIRKESSKLISTGLTVWRWDSPKYCYTHAKDEQYRYPEHKLTYPADETSPTRQIELKFTYESQDSTMFKESVSLFLYASGQPSISSEIWVSKYAETGYEGHGGSTLRDISEEDVANFGDLIAEIVGDEPLSYEMLIDQRLEEITNAAATEKAQQAIQNLVESTWPAQALYILRCRPKDGEKSYAKSLCDEETSDSAANAINEISAKYKALR